MPLVMPLCPRCRLRACAYQRPAFYGRLPRASTLCGECLRSVGADLLGSVIRVQPLPVRRGGSPAMPLPELEGGTSDETIAPPVRYCPDCGNCDCPNVASNPYWKRCPATDRVRRPAPVAPAPRVCTTSEGLEAALRESLTVARPLTPWASKPAARPAMARDLDRDERARCRRIGRTVLA